jgi:hypothetical protein
MDMKESGLGLILSTILCQSFGENARMKQGHHPLGLDEACKMLLNSLHQ